MKTLTIFVIMLAGLLSAQAQDKYISRNGHIWFYSKTPLEVIEAHNQQVASIINAQKGTIAFELSNKAFKFERALMEEHFNENYMESGKYIKSTFSGHFADFDTKNLSKDGSYNVTIEGDLTIHGVKKPVKQAGTLDVKSGKITAKAKFNVKPEDYNIKIPGLVRDKIASSMQINIDVVYSSN